MTLQEVTKNEFVVIDPNVLPIVYEHIFPLLQRACAATDGEYTPLSVVDLVLSGAIRLLAIVEGGSTVTSIMGVMIMQPINAGRRAEVVFVSGENVEEWLPFEHLLDAMALEAGCEKIRFGRGRKGWLKKLPHWRWAGIVMEKEL